MYCLASVFDSAADAAEFEFESDEGILAGLLLVLSFVALAAAAAASTWTGADIKISAKITNNLVVVEAGERRMLPLSLGWLTFWVLAVRFVRQVREAIAGLDCRNRMNRIESNPFWHSFAHKQKRGPFALCRMSHCTIMPACRSSQHDMPSSAGFRQSGSSDEEA